MTKNVIILDKIVKYNVLKIHKKGVLRIADYIINYCVNTNKDLLITHKGSVLRKIKSSDIILEIQFIENKEFDGSFLGKDISYKLAVLNVADKDN